MTEQVEDHVEVPGDHLVAGVQTPHCGGLLLDDPTHLLGRRVGLEPEEIRDAGDDRGPRAQLAVRRARRAHDDRVAVEPLDQFVGQPGLADAGLADDRHDTGVPVAHDLRGGVEHRPFADPPDERDVRPAGAGAGGRRTHHQPRLLDLIAPAQLGDPEGLGGHRGRAQRGGGAADQHASGRRQRLQAGGGVHDVAHRRVVGAGERADEHLAGVDADAHPDVGHAEHARRPLLDVARQRPLHPQRGAHGPLGVVLVSHWRAEQGDDGVAEQLVDPPTEVLDVDDEARGNSDSTSSLTFSGSRCSASDV